MKPQKKLKTYNITYRPDADNRYNTETVTYQADSMNEAKLMFYAEYPEQEKEDYLEIHSPLENYAIDRENEKLAETSNNDNDTTTDSTKPSGGALDDVSGWFKSAKTGPKKGPTMHETTSR